MGMLAATKVKMSGSEKQSEQEHKHFLHKACNLEVKGGFTSCKTDGKEMYKKVCCTCKVVFLLIRSIVVVFYRSRCLHLVFSTTRFYIFFEETINIKESFAFSLS